MNTDVPQFSQKYKELYPGPRPFQKAESALFFGRERETADLRDLVFAYRVVLLYAQSGAGKTSLVNAGLLPLLKEGDWLIGRVGGEVPPLIQAASITNIYVFNALLSSLGTEVNANRLIQATLGELLSRSEQIEPYFVIFDQFEELFTAYPERWEERASFFEQIKDLLGKNKDLHVLFVIREEHVAELDAYSDYLPNGFRIRYHLERLRAQAAEEAVVRPAQLAGFSFMNGVVKQLVEDLQTVRVKTREGARRVRGEFVEPMHLQVVCQNLFSNLSPKTITKDDVSRFADVDETLADFYDQALTWVVNTREVTEEKLRLWFDQNLITPAGTRGIVYMGEEQTGGIPNAAVKTLAERHVIRAELRAGSTWYELTHDRFIAPIRASNQAWKRIELIHNPTAMATAIDNFAPQHMAQRTGIGLALSGGGYRAALFHLGALRRLNELGILASLRTISSVSGGSILSAHLATSLSWPLPGPVPDWEERVAKPFRAFTSVNIRNAPVFKRWLLPWNWANSSVQLETLAAEYESKLTRLKLVDLPSKPNFIYCATDLAFGVDWNFQKAHIGDYQAGYIEPTPPDWPLAKAVAASSCFPPVFDPLRMPFGASQYKGGKAQGPSSDAARSGITLSDGGVYDNLGLEPIWKDHAIVLASDGRAVFDFEADKDFLGRVKRYVSIQGNQALALRKRWLISNFLAGIMQGTYWGIGSMTANYGPRAPKGYSEELSTMIAKIRTDLDCFSDAEKAILENHGYLLADAAVQQHLPMQLPKPTPELKIPYPEWMDESRAEQVLKDSWKRKIFGN